MSAHYRIAAQVIGLDPKVYRVNSFEDKGTHVQAKVSRVFNERACDRCGGKGHIHDERTYTLFTVPYQTRPCQILFSRKRFKCKRCSHTFFGKDPIFSSISPHLTRAAVDYVVERFKDGINLSSICGEVGASKTILGKVEKSIPLPKHRLPVHMCLDEVRAFKRKTATRNRVDSMSCCIYDADEKTVVDMLESDSKEAVCGYFKSFTKAERNQVKTVSCDLNGSYIAWVAEYFPNAVIYADKFHISKLVGGAIEQLRKDLIRSFDKDKHKDDISLLRKVKGTVCGRKAKAKGKSKINVFDALTLKDSDNLRLGYLCLQLYFEFVDGQYRTRDELEEALKHMAKPCPCH